MSSLSDRARLAAAAGRAQRLESLTAYQDAADTRGEFTLLYDGCEYGQHWGKLPNGGRVPVQLISSGTIRRGEVIVGVRGANGAIQVSAMP